METIKAHKQDNFFDFDTDILKDLVSEGYEGQELIDEFEKLKKKIPQAMDKLSEEAEKEPAMTKEEAEKYFGI